LRAHDEQRHSSTLRDYLQVVRRRKWIILQAIVLVPIVAVYLAAKQRRPTRHRLRFSWASSNSRCLTGIRRHPSIRRPTRLAATQAQSPGFRKSHSARSPNAGVARRTAGRVARSVLGHPGVEFEHPRLQRRRSKSGSRGELATAYAQAYTVYRHDLDTSTLKRARVDLEVRMETIRSHGGGGSAIYRQPRAEGRPPADDGRPSRPPRQRDPQSDVRVEDRAPPLPQRRMLD